MYLSNVQRSLSFIYKYKFLMFEAHESKYAYDKNFDVAYVMIVEIQIQSSFIECIQSMSGSL